MLSLPKRIASCLPVFLIFFFNTLLLHLIFIIFKDTDPVLKSELADDQPSQSFDIMTDSYDMMGTRRRSNTAQRLEKLRKERKFQSKTKVITWKSPTKIVEIFDSKTNRTSFKRVVLNPSTLTSEEIDMLEYDPIENVYCKLCYCFIY